MLKAHVSVSLDGFMAGPDVNVEQAMGRGGEDLHAWQFAEQQDPIDREVAAAMFSTATVGAVLMGRRTLDVGIGHWGDDGTFERPCFVVTHRLRAPVVKGATTFTFITDGIDTAVEQARASAGDKDINAMGADVIRHLVAGSIDELSITLVPIILGAGATLLGDLTPNVVQLDQIDARHSATVTHVRYRVRR
jgi:dihydrofolate reductase